jgi:hypothetical protein
VRNVIVVVLIVLTCGLAAGHTEKAAPVPSVSDGASEAARFTVIASFEGPKTTDPVVPIDVMEALEDDGAVRRVSFAADGASWDLKVDFEFGGLHEFLDWYGSPGGRETMSVLTGATKIPLKIHLDVAWGE